MSKESQQHDFLRTFFILKLCHSVSVEALSYFNVSRGLKKKRTPVIFQGFGLLDQLCTKC